jgi:hypothetical protein
MHPLLFFGIVHDHLFPNLSHLFDDSFSSCHSGSLSLAFVEGVRVQRS